jgi:SAM-dependent methyltransferase
MFGEFPAALSTVRADRVREAQLSLVYDPSTAGRSNGTAFKDPAFTENRTLPIHRWVPWIAGFSAGFVTDCLHEYLPGADPAATTVLDPFAGVGTTLVEAYRRGHNAVGFEINPYPALAARAKLEAAEIRIEELEFWIRAFRSAMSDLVPSSMQPTAARPPGFKSRIPFFSESIERQVLLALSFVRGMADQRLRDLFLVAIGSVMVRFSNYSYEPSLTSRPGAGKPLIEHADVTCVISEKLYEILLDSRTLQAERVAAPSVTGRVIHGSIFDAREHLPESSIDLAITSPPYLNNYHYIRNTRPHLFWLDMVADTSGLRVVEEASFGKFWQTVRDGEPIKLAFSLPSLESLLAELRKANPNKGVYGGGGWANYAAQYFNDTDRLFEVMSALLKPGGRMVIVIGNSILQGIEIKVEEFLAEIGSRHGLCCEAMHMLRTKRVGNSIVRSSVRKDSGSAATLYEVAVVLQRI